MTDGRSRRRAGLLIPLFACPSSASWGIGEIADLSAIRAWLAGAGMRVLQLLPINEMAAGQQSPYSAMSAMAIDPIFIRVPDVPEFARAGGEASLDVAARARLAHVRGTTTIDYPNVRLLKEQALRRCFERFVDEEWRPRTARAREFQAYGEAQAWWLDDYALFRALHRAEGERPWTDWTSDLRRRECDALDRARREQAAGVLFEQYQQWLAAGQWSRQRAMASPVAIYGDLPFMVDGDSADVWARQECFRLDASVGVPPDAFSATGQDWGMPVYRWDAIAATDDAWIRDRARRNAELYDGYRVDHLVGFYRTYGRPRAGGEPFFTPADEPSQIALGERLLGLFREPGADIIAEDLGTVPDFVRASLARLGVPGFKVFRWERNWHAAGQPFWDPRDYPPRSVATSGTHDTEPLVTWWAHASDQERRAVTALPSVRRSADDAGLAAEPFVPVVRDRLIEGLFASGSDLVLFPIQDVFGWSDRINEPATVTDRNWTFRLPWACDGMDQVAEACERQDALKRWATAHARL